MYRLGIILTVTVFCCITQVTGKPSNITRYSNVAYCQPYCDAHGYYQKGKWCYTDANMDVYCCGSQYDRYCCADEKKDIGDLYEPVDKCAMSSWWHYQWRVIIGLLGTVVVMLMMAACCYFCCGASINNRTAQRRRRAAIIASEQVGGHTSEIINNFDPSSPYAFTPPDYDSLPKEPPKYAEIYDGSGIVNPAYVPAPEVPANGNTGVVGVNEVPPSITRTSTSEGLSNHSENNKNYDDTHNDDNLPTISSCVPTIVAAPTSIAPTTNNIPTSVINTTIPTECQPPSYYSSSSAEGNLESNNNQINEEGLSKNGDSVSPSSTVTKNSNNRDDENNKCMKAQ